MKISDCIQNIEGKVLLGGDGIIDEVWQIVDVRIDAHNFKPMDNMKKFGELIVERGTGGLAKERVKKRRICGGFTGNVGRAVKALGLDTRFVGMYGTNTDNGIDPVFEELHEKSGTSHNIISIGDPAVCSILEFTDGKIMMPYLENLLNCDWPQIKSALEEQYGKAKNIFDGVQIASWGYWSNIPDFDNVLKGLLESYFKNVDRMFFDFANITKKSAEALRITLKVMQELNEKTPMSLSLNEHEGDLLLKYYNVHNLKALRDKIGIDEIIIHTPNEALIASANEGYVCVKQDFVENPIRTAGAGDAFNGGYIAACLGNIDAEKRLLIANAATNFYLKNAKPPAKSQLAEYFDL